MDRNALQSQISTALVFIGSSVMFLKYTLSILRYNQDRAEFKYYDGSCHCQSIKIRVKAPKHLVVWDCNCSICYMKRNHHFIIPERNFELIQGEDFQSEYQFNTKVAKHIFCKNCGVQVYYRPRSNPDGFAITLYCIPQNQLHSFEVLPFNGLQWESFIASSGIQKYSK